MCTSTYLVIAVKGYLFRYALENEDFVSEPDFVPFVWRNDDNDDRGNEK